MKQALVAALVSLAAVAANAEPRSIQVITTDGREFRGVPEFDRVKIRTSKAMLTFQLENIAELRFKAGESGMVLIDQREYRGEVQLPECVVSNTLGRLRLGREVLQSIRPLPLSKPPGTTLEAAAKRPFGVVLKGRPALRPGSDEIVLLDGTGGTLVQVSMKDLSIRPAVKLLAGGSVLALAPTGKFAAVVSGKSVSLIDLERGTVMNSFEVDTLISDLVVLDEETLLASCDGGILVISTAQKAVVRRVLASGGAFLPAPGGRKVYGSRYTLELPASAPYNAADLDPALFPLDTAFHPERFAMSPDGRLAVGLEGEVLRTAKSDRADLAPLGRIKPHGASAVLPGARRLLAFTESGEVHDYSLPNLALKATRKLGHRVVFALPDESRNAVFAWVIPPNAPPEASPGDLVVLPLPE